LNLPQASVGLGLPVKWIMDKMIAIISNHDPNKLAFEAVNKTVVIPSDVRQSA
jgi:hypothetical protein